MDEIDDGSAISVLIAVCVFLVLAPFALEHREWQKIARAGSMAAEHRTLATQVLEPARHDYHLEEARKHDGERRKAQMRLRRAPTTYAVCFALAIALCSIVGVALWMGSGRCHKEETDGGV